MFLQRLILAVGTMTIAYALSEASIALAKKIDQIGKLKFIFYILFAIYYFSAMASLFVGLFMYFQKEKALQLQRSIDDLSKSQHESKKKYEALSLENEQLYNRLHDEVHRAEKRSFESGRLQGYVNGYGVGFEDCMDVLNLDEDIKSSMIPMARKSGCHRIKTRPSIFDGQKAVNIDGILR